MPAPFEIFKTMLLEEAGDALERRGYRLQDDAIQLRGGLYRFAKTLPGEALALIDVQLLFYAEGGPSRMSATMWRSDEAKRKINLGVWLHEHGMVTEADRLGWWEFASARELR
jgi:hypothetical protein